MLTLEQVRAVNDGLSRGDWNAALRPLEEQIDLRHAELPKLEKPALAALLDGLKTPETARFWANTVFAPNVSVRRFVRKTFLGFKEGAAPLALPLQEALEEFWARETPLPFSNRAREAAARREQIEIVQSALEILLRADPPRFIRFWAQVIEASKPLLAQQQAQSLLWNERHAAYSAALKIVLDDLVRAEWGEEFLEPSKAAQLPSRVWRELREAAQNRPEIQKLLAEMGENPWASAAQQWQPETLFSAALAPYVAHNASAAQREVAARAQSLIREWLDQVFDSSDVAWPTPAANDLAACVLPMLRFCRFDNATIWENFLPWLLRSRAALLPHLEEHLQRTDYRGRSQGVAGLWMALTEMLLHSLNRPYNIKPEEWKFSDFIQPDDLLSLRVGSFQNRWSLVFRLEQTAKEIEASRAPRTPEIENAVETPLPSPPAPDAIDFGLGGVYHEYQLSKAESQKTGEKQDVILARWRGRIYREIEAFTTPAERRQSLLSPPLYLEHSVPRLSLWQVWEEKTPDLQAQLWPLVGERLWTLYEEKLEAYRRVETDEIAPKLGEKLTARELKEWKTDQRARKRGQIQQEILDIGALLRLGEKGAEWDTELKKMRLLDRPGCRELLRTHQASLLAQITYFPSLNHDTESRAKAQDADWLREHWFLGEKWAPIIAELETALLDGKKVTDWQKSSWNRQFAVAHYRLQTPPSRARFLELAAQCDNISFELALPVTALRDTQAWLLMLAHTDHFAATMRDLWTQTRANSPQDAEKLTAQVLESLSTITRERAAKFQIELVADLTPAELSQNVASVVAALESPLVAVKRWALAALPKIETEYDAETAAQLVGEMLWNENGALVKDAIKFLGAQRDEAALLAFESLQDALTLENQPILELVLRALSNLKGKNADLQLGEAARERVAELARLAPPRFEKFSKKLA